MSQTDTLRNENGEENSASRRTLLRAAGVTAGVVVTPTVVGAANNGGSGASERADRVHDQALLIREKTGSHQKFKRFLANNANYFKSNQTTFEAPSDGVSTREWTSEAFATVDLTLTYYYDSCTSGDPYAYFDYYVRMDTDHVHGEGGPDQLSVSWNDDHYRYEEGSAYHVENHDLVSLSKESLNGVDWEWEDGNACYFDCANPKDFTVGCKAQLLTTDQERGVEASYWEMYQDATVSSVGFSSSGDINFSYSTTGETDQHAFKIEEDSDAASGCTP